MSQKTILVTAANGNVGSSLAKQLLDQGFNVNALVRNTDSNVARDLEQRGAKIFKGDFDDVSSLQKASQSIWGVFVNASPVPGTLDELRHNISVINAAKEAGAKFGIYLSVVMAERKDEFPGMNPQNASYNYWQSKHGTEKALQEAGFDYWTIIRPAMFLSNFFGPFSNFLWPDFRKRHVLVSPFSPTITMPMVDTDEIAKYAATAFADPDTFNGLAIDLSNEDITLDDFAKLLTNIAGIQVTTEYISPEELVSRGLPPRILTWQQSVRALNYRVDYERLDQLPVKRATVAEYIKKNKESIVEVLSA
ncbi:hypothetical protein BGW37DRAFT_429233 [Umbelopsis sp. PMI_123]|nr:hypothetical protein BGW37DRAFT_429233 [Umbelopsis sp. PMI_123]